MSASSTVSLQQLLNDGLVHHRNGRLAEAEALYRRMLELQPDQPDALNLLGVIALQSSKPQQAEELLRRSVQKAPTFATLNNFGEALRQLGRLSEAIDIF